MQYLGIITLVLIVAGVLLYAALALASKLSEKEDRNGH